MLLREALSLPSEGQEGWVVVSSESSTERSGRIERWGNNRIYNL